MSRKDQSKIRLIRDYLLEITIPLVCGYCGKPLTPEEATLDHINPQADGHETTIYNSVLACSPCNTEKGNKYKEPTTRPPISIKTFIEFTKRMKRINPSKYWGWKYKATREYEKETGRRIT